MITLDFDKYRPPIMELVLKDDERTILHLTPPTVALQEELVANDDRLSALLSGEDEDARAGLVDLAARLMSCNRNWLKITPADIKKKYRLDEEDLTVFFNLYTEFLQSIRTAKN